jgi:hypothetical protein
MRLVVLYSRIGAGQIYPAERKTFNRVQKVITFERFCFAEIPLRGFISAKG